MTRAPISDLKARLSRYLDMVRAGEDVIVTDRGKPIARITPISDSLHMEERLERLVRTGEVRPPVRKDALDLDQLTRPADPEGRARALLLEERAEGR
ncbi:MAG: type II toxin-antitoxin system prevent-host-death family antitoxin [Gemmatimonadetes bacterium]|nr:type II toxin-antitoxin system prevent-host-death family antitoxin [Gemmatimonadota bacterium]